MTTSISQDFTPIKLLKFALPTMAMMCFLSLYSMVDGLFVSNFVGEVAFSALNIVYPYITILIAVATMFSTGGTAFVSKLMGENKQEQANKAFTLIVLTGLGVSAVLALCGTVFTEPIVRLLGATDNLIADATTYLFIMALFCPMQFLQILGQMFFVVAGRPNLGLVFSVGGGVLNIILDYVFIAIFKMGIMGAALATAASYCLPAVAFCIYFSLKGKSGLRFQKPIWSGKTVLNTCTNGSSEMVTNLSNSITNVLFNIIVLVYAGEMGVVAVGVLLYAQFFLLSMMLGYSSGIAPIIGYAYGAQNYNQLKNVFKISFRVIIVCSLVSFAISLFGADVITGFFVEPNSPTFTFTSHAFTLFSLCYLFMGINIFASAFFTALSNGKVSAILSFIRTFVLLVGALLILPLLFEINGVWLAMPVAEFSSLFLSIYYLLKLRKQYRY